MKKYFSICLVFVMFNFLSYAALASGKKKGKPTDEFTNLLKCIEKGSLKQVEKILKKNRDFVNQSISNQEYKKETSSLSIIVTKELRACSQ